jgi:CRISPR-associated exonuclease Cas4
MTSTSVDEPVPGDPRYDEDELLPISALQHLVFCERQCALIHVEGLWAENRLTVQGRHLHERADSGLGESRPGLRIERGLALRSFRLGLAGRADVIEFHRGDGGATERVVPVEYKRGRAKLDDCDRVQLCAQALCLEEMLGVDVPEGALYYGQTRRRVVVPLDAALRSRTDAAARRFRALMDAGHTPKATRMPKCASCSLEALCLPDAQGARRSARRFTERALAASLDGGMPTGAHGGDACGIT